MHTMVVRMSIDPERADEAARHLREDVVAWARQQPGFVNGQWLRSPDGSEGIGVVVFASPDAATSAARGPRSYPRRQPGLERRGRHRLRAAHIGLARPPPPGRSSRRCTSSPTEVTTSNRSRSASQSRFLRCRSSVAS